MKHPVGKDQNGNEILAEAVPFEALNEGWNEYKVEDGTVVRVKTVVTSILKTDLRNEFGETVYMVKSQTISDVVAAGRSRSDQHDTDRQRVIKTEN